MLAIRSYLERCFSKYIVELWISDLGVNKINSRIFLGFIKEINLYVEMKQHLTKYTIVLSYCISTYVCSYYWQVDSLWFPHQLRIHSKCSECETETCGRQIFCTKMLQSKRGVKNSNKKNLLITDIINETLCRSLSKVFKQPYGTIQQEERTNLLVYESNIV